jgi:hypothetical protein
MINDYTFETNWSDFSAQFRAIEDYLEVITEPGFVWAIDNSALERMIYINDTTNYTFSGVCPKCGQVHYGKGDYHSVECPIAGGRVMFNGEGELVEGY